MAVAATPVAGASHVAGNKRVRVYDLVFSSNYAAAGEVVNASDVGLRKIERIDHNGVALATATTTGDIVHSTINSTGTTATFTFLQTGTSADTPLNEKGVEAHITGAALRAAFIGY